jgi:hypothetical protein
MVVDLKTVEDLAQELEKADRSDENLGQVTEIVEKLTESLQSADVVPAVKDRTKEALDAHNERVRRKRMNRPPTSFKDL